MDAVISLGGSIVAQMVEDDTLDDYLQVLNDLADETDTLVIVTGAGPLKRYISAVDAPEARKDLIGIQATRLHASMLSAALDANAAVPDDLETVHELARTHKVVVLGGLLPGQSTDAVAAECAEIIEADRLVLATTVDGVYSTDPDTADDADRYDTIAPDALLDLIRDQESGAGTYALIDVTAATLIQRSSLDTVVLDGRDPDTLARCLGDDHGGTVITD